MEIIRDRKNKRLFLTQSTYLKKVVQKFNMHEAKEVSIPLGQHFKLSAEQSPYTPEEVNDMASIPYSNGVESIMYSMVCSRLDLAHAINVVSKFMANPGRVHWEALKWLLRYIKGSVNLCLVFGKQEISSNKLVGYIDANFVGNIDIRKFLTGYVFTLFGTAISWKSMLQSVVALSTTEAEYIAVTEAIKEVMWLQGILCELGVHQQKVTVFCDNYSTIHLTKHQFFMRGLNTSM